MALVRWLVGVTLFVALLFLALQNDELVTVRFYHWSWPAPLIFLILIAFAAGAAAGLLAGLFRSARLKRQLIRLRREVRRAPVKRPVDGG